MLYWSYCFKIKLYIRQNIKKKSLDCFSFTFDIATFQASFTKSKTKLKAKKLHPMAQTDRHNDSMNESAQYGQFNERGSKNKIIQSLQTHID